MRKAPPTEQWYAQQVACRTSALVNCSIRRTIVRSTLDQAIALWIRPNSRKRAGFTRLCSDCRMHNSAERCCLEHQLQSGDDLVKLVLAKPWIGFAEIGPSMNVVYHRLKIVAVDVVI